MTNKPTAGDGIMNHQQDYRRLDGKSTDVDDLDRGIWYGAGNCTYWTDDWTKVSKKLSGIPCCPKCGSVGLQTTARDWFGGVARFQRDGNPGYVNFIKQSAEQCMKPLGFMEWFRQWLIEHPNGRETNPRSGGD